SLDELPQFFNTLFGSMSVVGPRPEIPEIVMDYSAFQKQVLAVRPGITGLPQVNGRAELSIPKKLRLDVYYTKKSSICFDLYIIYKTVIVLFTGKGAF
ncbi:MAG: sugar transferase, partial [Candidatus Firestonebacteria bacterium]